MKQMPKMVLELEEALIPHVSGTQARFSKRGVPHLVVWFKDDLYSLCFFGKSKIWRLFHPYFSRGGPQTKKDFFTIESIANYFKEASNG